MKKKLLPILLGFSGMFIWSCETEHVHVKSSGTYKPNGNRISTLSTANEVITFEGFTRGTIVNEVNSANGIGPIKVLGSNPDFPGQNAAMIFNSSMPTGDDPDLGTPNQDFGGPGIGEGGQMSSDPNNPNPYENIDPLGNLLIISEDMNSDNPDDENEHEGSLFEFDFSIIGPVTVYSMNLIDVEGAEVGANVKFFDLNGDQIGLTVELPSTGDNGVALIIFGGVSGVAKMSVFLNGSGAIDNIEFEKNEVVGGCTYTQGYWKTHSKYGPAKPRNSTWDKIGEDTQFFLSSISYHQVLKTAPEGNAYYILAHQYIAATLNKLNSASVPTDVAIALSTAQSLFTTYTPATIAQLDSESPLRKQFIDLATLLDNYNNGLIGPGHCAESK